MPSSCAFNWLLAARVLYAYFEARDVADSNLYTQLRVMWASHDQQSLHAREKEVHAQEMTAGTLCQQLCWLRPGWWQSHLRLYLSTSRRSRQRMLSVARR